MTSNVTNFQHDFVIVFICFWGQFPTTQTHKNKQNASEGYQKSENPSLAFTFEKWSQKVTKSLSIGSPKWSKWRPKNILNPCSKYHRKIKQKILNLGSKMGGFFGVFGCWNRPPKAPGAQQSVKTEHVFKIIEKVPKNHYMLHRYRPYIWKHEELQTPRKH